MMKRSVAHAGLSLLLLLATALSPARAQDSPEVSVGVDLMSRYVWRGLNAGDAPSIQPSISVGVKGLEIGSWGAYSLSNEITGGDEIDLWIGYSIDLEGGGALGVLVTDYYFPNGGEGFGNYADYDDEDGPGAHTLELGGSFTFPSFPLTVAGYVNFHNDEGHNVYFQADWPLTVGETALNLFAGATPGSEDNPDYYGTRDFAFINIGLTAERQIGVTDRFSLPLTASWILNPEQDIAYLVVGLSL